VLLDWAATDVRRFTRMLAWLSLSMNWRVVTLAEADAELDDRGLTPAACAPLRRLLAAVRAREGVPGALAGALGPCADLARQALHELPADAPERPRFAKLHAVLLVRANLLAPGTLDWADIDEAAVATPETDPAGRAVWARFGGIQEQALVTLVDSSRLSLTGDQGHLRRSVARLRTMIRDTPVGETATSVQRDLVGLLAAALNQAALREGSLQDNEAALALIRESLAACDRDGTPPPIELTVSAAILEIGLARRGEDTAALARLVEQLTGHHAALPPGHGMRFAVAGVLSDAHEALAGLTGDAEGLRAAARYVREVVDTEPQHVPPMLASFLPALRADGTIRLVFLDPSREAARRAVAEVHRALSAPHSDARQETWLLTRLGQALLHAARNLNAPKLFGRCIAVLNRAAELAAAGPGRPSLATARAALSDAHWEVAQHLKPGTDRRRHVSACLAAGRESLLTLSVDVLLQSGVEHGLTVARAGAAQALHLAYRSTLADRRTQAVEALELGRALVLRAAAASRSIPELLEAAGRADLAAQWSTATPADLLRPGAAAQLLDSPAGSPLPSSLRRLVLDTLGTDAGRLLGVPDLHALSAGLTQAGADALVYLVPGTQPGTPGYALLVRPAPRAPDGAPPQTLRPALLKLPLLTPRSAPLERYLDAAAQRSRKIADPTLHSSWRAAWDGHWQAALRDLCDWAWAAVMGPVLAAVSPLDRRPRIVLVPCGRLGTVPWHAARTALDPGDAGAGHRYACQEAVISYAASGGQFLQAAARRRMPAAGRGVLVADPSLTLFWAEIETDALHSSCYPEAFRYGEFPSAGEAPDAPATPEDVLAVLPGGERPTPVLHLACHAVAGPSPTRSALRLANPPGAPPEAGDLTVARLLDSPTRLPGDTGPLVVLSACETDLSTRDHDEALTLATALLSRGAADVVGSRWAVTDAATALMMALFHHFLTNQGQAPADALRQTQLWMLNPHRTPPPGLPEPLRREAARTDLDRVHLWAGFTHQGTPAAADG
jgi:hypothetical protein